MIKLVTLCKSSRPVEKPSVTAQCRPPTVMMAYRWYLFSVFGKSHLSVIEMKPGLQSRPPRSAPSNSLQLFFMSQRVCFSPSGFETEKQTFLNVLLQCERGQRHCIFVKYEIYHQSISKHNV